MPLYIFDCDCGEFEERAGVEESTLPCPSCGKPASRRFCSGLPYISGDTVAKVNLLANRGGNIKDKHGRTRVSVFQEAAQEVDYIHKKAENEAGRELPHPDLYKRALQRARTENAPKG